MDCGSALGWEPPPSTPLARGARVPAGGPTLRVSSTRRPAASPSGGMRVCLDPLAGGSSTCSDSLISDFDLISPPHIEGAHSSQHTASALHSTGSLGSRHGLEQDSVMTPSGASIERVRVAGSAASAEVVGNENSDLVHPHELSIGSPCPAPNKAKLLDSCMEANGQKVGWENLVAPSTDPETPCPWEETPLQASTMRAEEAQASSIGNVVQNSHVDELGQGAIETLPKPALHKFSRSAAHTIRRIEVQSSLPVGHDSTIGQGPSSAYVLEKAPSLSMPTACSVSIFEQTLVDMQEQTSAPITAPHLLGSQMQEAMPPNAEETLLDSQTTIPQEPSDKLDQTLRDSQLHAAAIGPSSQRALSVSNRNHIAAIPSQLSPSAATPPPMSHPLMHPAAPLHRGKKNGRPCSPSHSDTKPDDDAVSQSQEACFHELHIDTDTAPNVGKVNGERLLQSACSTLGEWDQCAPLHSLAKADGEQNDPPPQANASQKNHNSSIGASMLVREHSPTRQGRSFLVASGRACTPYHASSVAVPSASGIAAHVPSCTWARSMSDASGANASLLRETALHRVASNKFLNAANPCLILAPATPEEGIGPAAGTAQAVDHPLFANGPPPLPESLVPSPVMASLVALADAPTQPYEQPSQSQGLLSSHHQDAGFACPNSVAKAVDERAAALETDEEECEDLANVAGETCNGVTDRRTPPHLATGTNQRLGEGVAAVLSLSGIGVLTAAACEGPRNATRVGVHLTHESISRDTMGEPSSCQCSNASADEEDIPLGPCSVCGAINEADCHSPRSQRRSIRCGTSPTGCSTHFAATFCCDPSSAERRRGCGCSLCLRCAAAWFRAGSRLCPACGAPVRGYCVPATGWVRELERTATRDDSSTAERRVAHSSNSPQPFPALRGEYSMQAHGATPSAPSNDDVVSPLEAQLPDSNSLFSDLVIAERKPAMSKCAPSTAEHPHRLGISNATDPESVTQAQDIAADIAGSSGPLPLPPQPSTLPSLNGSEGWQADVLQPNSMAPACIPCRMSSGCRRPDCLSSGAPASVPLAIEMSGQPSNGSKAALVLTHDMCGRVQLPDNGAQEDATYVEVPCGDAARDGLGRSHPPFATTTRSKEARDRATRDSPQRNSVDASSVELAMPELSTPFALALTTETAGSTVEANFEGASRANHVPDPGVISAEEEVDGMAQRATDTQALVGASELAIECTMPNADHGHLDAVAFVVSPRSHSAQQLDDAPDLPEDAVDNFDGTAAISIARASACSPISSGQPSPPSDGSVASCVDSEYAENEEHFHQTQDELPWFRPPIAAPPPSRSAMHRQSFRQQRLNSAQRKPRKNIICNPPRSQRKLAKPTCLSPSLRQGDEETYHLDNEDRVHAIESANASRVRASSGEALDIRPYSDTHQDVGMSAESQVSLPRSDIQQAPLRGATHDSPGIMVEPTQLVGSPGLPILDDIGEAGSDARDDECSGALENLDPGRRGDDLLVEAPLVAKFQEQDRFASADTSIFRGSHRLACPVKASATSTPGPVDEVASVRGLAKAMPLATRPTSSLQTEHAAWAVQGEARSSSASHVVYRSRRHNLDHRGLTTIRARDEVPLAHPAAPTSSAVVCRPESMCRPESPRLLGRRARKANPAEARRMRGQKRTASGGIERRQSRRHAHAEVQQNCSLAARDAGALPTPLEPRRRERSASTSLAPTGPLTQRDDIPCNSPPSPTRSYDSRWAVPSYSHHLNARSGADASAESVTWVSGTPSNAARSSSRAIDATRSPSGFAPAKDLANEAADEVEHLPREHVSRSSACSTLPNGRTPFAAQPNDSSPHAASRRTELPPGWFAEEREATSRKYRVYFGPNRTGYAESLPGAWREYDRSRRLGTVRIPSTSKHHSPEQTITQAMTPNDGREVDGSIRGRRRKPQAYTDVRCDVDLSPRHMKRSRASSRPFAGFAAILTGVASESKGEVEASLRAAGAYLVDVAELRAAFQPPVGWRQVAEQLSSSSFLPPAEVHARLVTGRLLLIAGGQAKTLKLYFALALGLSPLSIEWALRCTKAGRFSEPRPEDFAINMPSMQPASSLLRGKTVVPVGSDEWISNVASLLQAAGADVRAELPRLHHAQNPGSDAVACVILAEAPDHDRSRAGILRRAKMRRIPIVSLDWLRDGLLRQRCPAFIDAGREAQM